MALRGLAGSEPSSRGPLEVAVAAAEEREAPAVVAAAAAREDDEEDDGRGRGLLRWDGFSAWLHCVCVVGFDLELGQAVEVRPGRSVVPAPCPGSRRSALSIACGSRPSGGRRASGRGWPLFCRWGRAAIHLQFPWEALGLRLGVKSSTRPLLNNC